MQTELLKEAGLTEGEIKVYLSLLEIGTSTTGPIIEKSKIAKSIIYQILEKLIDKGLVSFIIKEKTKYFQAAQPQKILDYIDERKEKLEENRNKVENMLPKLISIAQPTDGISVQVFEGFKGFVTSWELMYSKLKKGDEYHAWGIYPLQEERFHLYWERDNLRRKKLGFEGKLLFNKGTPKEILKNRNSFKGSDARYMNSNIKTPAWFVVYKDTTIICLQTLKIEEDGPREKPASIVIINKKIAQTFEAYFQELWKDTKPLK
jgi:HTH-type transcriptional regulator, sugar sensing transcriptional regulator